MEGVEILFRPFLTGALGGDERPGSHPSRLIFFHIRTYTICVDTFSKPEIYLIIYHYAISGYQTTNIRALIGCMKA
jgi:hypothetical protein